MTTNLPGEDERILNSVPITDSSYDNDNVVDPDSNVRRFVLFVTDELGLKSC